MERRMEDHRATLLFDGECSFCRRWAWRWKAVTGRRVVYRRYQKAAGEFPQVPREEFGKAVYLFEPDGRVSRGAGAVFRVLELAGRKPWLGWAYRNVPGFKEVSEGVYGFVARHRDGMERLDRVLMGEKPVMYRLTRRVFLIGLAVIYLCAFWSLYVQIDGLLGSHGILPAADYMGRAWEAADVRGIGWSRFVMLPTVCWVSASDGMLHGLCWVGMAGAVLMMARGVPGVAALVCWVCYLSLVTVGQDFLGFQWDSLLLEAGFLAIFLSPWVVLPKPVREERPPSGAMILLVRWLVFRLMFLSGVVKLASGDVTWRAWEALKYHYETQPLPPWTAWYMHHLAGWFQKTSVGFMFLVELVVPFFVFGPRRVRVVGFWFIVGLQVLIAATGNYGYFNWLAIVLCVVLLDDALLPGGRRFLRLEVQPRRVRVMMGAWLKGAVAVVILAASVPQVLAAMGYLQNLPAPLGMIYQWTESLRMTSPYGLFAVMTTERPEIVVEHSEDGVRWEEYSFRYKPGDVMRRPGFCEPHMPRLDWMMWFAALGGGPEQSPWFGEFVKGLLEGRPEVLGLMDRPPEGRPRYVRAVLYQYHFTTRAERARTGAWWRRERVGVWFPEVAGGGAGSGEERGR